ncbi:MAG: ABC transporter ATP-binding protein [Clostridiales bacterium]|nr:ABC transporter ATP-binding protein [Clostridiales bacterium]
MASTPLVEAQSVHKVFRTGQVKVHALRGVTLQFYPGEFTSIMGPSGSGKSTLLNLIGCLDRPTKGEIFIAGESTRRLSDSALADLRNRTIGFVFQDFSLLPQLTALENVELPLIYRGMPGKRRREKALRALEQVGLLPRAHHRPAQLSGGEQQRVAIARALVGEPSLILADEPTGALDSRNGQAIMAIFQRLNREQGLTILQVTHDEQIARHSRRIVRLRDGTVVAEEAVAEPLLAQEMEAVEEEGA